MRLYITVPQKVGNELSFLLVQRGPTNPNSTDVLSYTQTGRVLPVHNRMLLGEKENPL